MTKKTLKIIYDEEKIKAIRLALSEKDKDFEAEIIGFIDNLYEKNVPKVLKKYIENSSELEAEATEKKKEE